MSLSLKLLGDFEARANGIDAGFATNAARALLAYLAASPGRAFTRETLSAFFWPDKPQSAAFANLRQTIVRMKDGLGSAGAAVIEISSNALRFIPHSADVDIWQFERLLAESAKHNHADGLLCADCLAHLGTAVALYRDEFLHGLALHGSDTFEDWLLLSREQFRRHMLEALQSLSRHYEQQQAHAQVLEFAARQLALEPWREEAHAQKMRALAALGQRAAAIAQYRAYCQVMEHELGIGPSHDLRVLFERIQAGRLSHRQGVVSQSTDAPASLGAGLPRHDLPEQLTPFIGREAELAELARWLRDPAIRLMTLTGPGGMGKTRLAIETARSRMDDFPHGVFFVSLAALSSEEAIVPAICAAINCPVQATHPLHGLMRFLSGKQMLLILDNLEHLMAGVDEVMQLLQAASRLRILVTSREKLNVQGEHVYVVHGLDHATRTEAGATDAMKLASAQLFAQSARRIDTHFKITPDNLPAVLRIAQLVQGMPLGLELAAAWIGALAPDEIAAEISKSAGFLEAQWRDLPERQRNMRAVFDWSWNLLNADERAALCKASVFCGAFSRAAAGEVASITLQQLARLIHKSLLTQQDDGRYALHELLRQLAGERLEERPALKADVLSRHSAWYLAWLAARERRLLRNEPVEASDEIKAEIDNVRQAWLHACHQARVVDLERASIALWQFCGNNGLAGEGIRLFEAALNALAHAHGATAAIALFTAIIGSLSMVLGRHDEALAASERAVALSEAGGNPFAQALSWLVQGQALRRKGQTPPARALLERVIAFAREQRERAPRETPERWALLETRAMNWLCSFDVVDAKYEAVQNSVAQSLALGRRLDMRRVVAVSLMDRVTLALMMGDWETLRQTLKEAGRMSAQVGSLNGVAYSLRVMSLLARHDGDYDTAMQFILQARARYQDAGDGVGDAYILLEEGMLRVLMGDFAPAQDCLDAADRILHTLGEPVVEMFALQCARAWLAHHAGPVNEALAAAEVAGRMAQLLDIPAHMGDALVLLGLAQEAAGLMPVAGQSFQRAIALFERLRLPHKMFEPHAGLARMALAMGDASRACAMADEVLALVSTHKHASPILSPRSPAIPVPLLGTRSGIWDDDFRTRIWGGADEPFRIMLTCWRVLQMAGDPRAADVLALTRATLDEYAGHIADATLRQSFLTNVPLHREIVNAPAV